MTDLHALSGAYALDAVDEQERAEFERHLTGCADCGSELEGLRETAALLSALTATPPPAAARDRLLATVAAVRPLPPEVVTPIGSARRPRRRGFVAALVAAAVVAVAGIGAAVLEPWRDDQPPPLTAAERVLGADDAAAETLRFPGGASARLVRSDSLHRAVLVTTAMPPAPEGKVYQLWYDVPGQGMVSAGVMPPDPDQTVLLDGDASVATGAGITVEPAGGSLEPTSDPIALFAFTELEPA